MECFSASYTTLQWLQSAGVCALERSSFLKNVMLGVDMYWDYFCCVRAN